MGRDKAKPKDKPKDKKADSTQVVSDDRSTDDLIGEFLETGNESVAGDLEEKAGSSDESTGLIPQDDLDDDFEVAGAPVVAAPAAPPAPVRDDEDFFSDVRGIMGAAFGNDDSAGGAPAASPAPVVSSAPAPAPQVVAAPRADQSRAAATGRAVNPAPVATQVAPPPTVNVGEDIPAIQRAMTDVRGWNFTPVTRERQTASTSSKANTRLSAFFTRVGKVAANVALSPIALIVRLKSGHKLHKAEKRAQQAKSYDAIPGWDGATFQKAPNETGLDILKDERRVPTIWANIIAEEAEDSNRQLKAPSVTIFVQQPKPGSGEHMDAEGFIGHAMIGLNYSRYSNLTKKNERYSIKYGFYPGGGFSSNGANLLMANGGAMVPGELKDDRDHPFSISRRYPATMDQVSRIVKASETYAQGGYGYYNRNCTTFVRDMIEKEGQIGTVGNDVFKVEEVGLNRSSNLKRWAAGAWSTYFASGVRKRFVELSGKEDQKYQNFGNSRVTAEDMRRFEKSTREAPFVKRGYTPAGTGEGLRMQKGQSAGVLSSFEYSGDPNVDLAFASRNPAALKSNISRTAAQLRTAILSTIPQDKVNSMPQSITDYVDMMNDLPDDALDRMVGLFTGRSADQLFKSVTGDDIKRARNVLSSQSEMVGWGYNIYLGSDPRLDTPVMNLLSVYQIAIDFLDEQYGKAVDQEAHSEGDLGGIVDRFLFENGEFQVTLEDGSVHTINNITPSLYEGYVQAYRDPVAAAQAIYKLYVGGQGSTPDPNLQRMDELAKSFERAHKYMLSRGEYSQQDVDYAMKLDKKENERAATQKGAVDPGVTAALGKNAGAVYKTLILEKIIGGLKDRISEKEQDGTISPMQLFRGERGALQRVLSTYLSECFQAHNKEFKMILKGLDKLSPGNRREVMEGLKKMLKDYARHTYGLNPSKRSDMSMSGYLMVALDNLFTGGDLYSYVLAQLGQI